jgi:hypothetical protein
MTMPIIAMTDRSSPNSFSVTSAPIPAAGQAGQDGQRVDEALIEDAEDDVDHQHRREEQQPLVGERLLEELAVPWKVVWT